MLLLGTNLLCAGALAVWNFCNICQPNIDKEQTNVLPSERGPLALCGKFGLVIAIRL